MDGTPHIYVASLADYNAGVLHGRWIDADQPVAVVHEQIAEMLAQSREPIAEDWAIHDYENFGGLRLREFENLEHVTQVAAGIGEHGPLFAELVSHFGGTSNIEEAQRSMEEGYRGEWDSLADFAEELIKECFGNLLEKLPDFIRCHIDYESIGRDMELGGDVFTINCNDKLHVFDARF